MPQLLTLSLLFVTLVLSPQASAQSWVIPAGQEELIGSLFEPYFSQAAPGWRLRSVEILSSQIVAHVEAENGAEGTVTLMHPQEHTLRGNYAQSQEFSIVVRGHNPAVRAANALLVERVIANDRGGVWSQPGTEREARVETSSGGSVLICLLLCLVLVLVRQLRKSPRSVAFILFGITGAGAAVRLSMSQPTLHGAWPYSRTQMFAWNLWNDWRFAELAGESATLLYMDFQFAVSFAFAVLTPLAVYCHASQLLHSARAGLFAAFMMAMLPMHIRFSISEVAFIPSIILSSLSFALLHSALKEEVRIWRWVTAVALVPVSYIAFTARPLNIIFGGLLVYTAFVLVPRTIPTARKLLVSFSLLVSSSLAIALSLFANHKNTIQEQADPLMILKNTITVLFSFEHNTLIRPDVTPVLLTLLAGYGAWCGWQGQKRRVAVFLVGWLGLFLTSHSIITPEQIEMTARYHLHLVVPFVLLAALGIDEIVQKEPRLLHPLIGLIALSPLMCYPFIRNVAFAEMGEYEYVRELVDELPRGCTVLEYTPNTGVDELRFERVGLELREGELGQRFESVSVSTEDFGAGMDASTVELLRAPPECVYFYRGVTCFVGKEEHRLVAPVCDDVLDFAQWEKVSERSFANIPYNLAISLNVPPPTDQIRVELYRLTGAAQPGTRQRSDAPEAEPGGEEPAAEPSAAEPSEDSAPPASP